MKILLTGAAGQLGNELYPLLTTIGEVTAVDMDPRNSNAPACRAIDLGHGGQLETLLNRLDPDLVVNAAAYTAVDRAENEPELAFRTNAEMPGRLARWAQRNGHLLLQYSTDYIFDGRSTRPYIESDAPLPLNLYGESKLAGERAIQASGCRGLILRTSWVYSSHGNNFVLSMLRLGRQQLQLRVVDDQVGCPTWARNLARATRQVIVKTLHGRHFAGCPVYHYCDRDPLSWHDFAAMVFETAVRLGLLAGVPELLRVSSDEYPQVATRPRFSVLDTSAIQADTGVEPQPLQASLDTCMREIDAQHE